MDIIAPFFILINGFTRKFSRISQFVPLHKMFFDILDNMHNHKWLIHGKKSHLFQ